MRPLLLGMALALPLVAQVARAGEERTECTQGPLPQPNAAYGWPQVHESTMGGRMDPRYVPASFGKSVRSDGNSIFTRRRARV